MTMHAKIVGYPCDVRLMLSFLCLQLHGHAVGNMERALDDILQHPHLVECLKSQNAHERLRIISELLVAHPKVEVFREQHAVAQSACGSHDAAILYWSARLVRTPDMLDVQHGLKAALQYLKPVERAGHLRHLRTKFTEHAWLDLEMMTTLADLGEFEVVVSYHLDQHRKCSNLLDRDLWRDRLGALAIKCAQNQPKKMKVQMECVQPILSHKQLFHVWCSLNEYAHATKELRSAIDTREVTHYDQREIALQLVKMTLVPDTEDLLYAVLACHTVAPWEPVHQDVESSIRAMKPEDPLWGHQFLYRARPTNTRYRDNLYQALHQSDDVVASIDMWTRLLLEHPASGALHDHLTKALSRADNTDLGIETWARLVEQHPSQPAFLSRLDNLLSVVADVVLENRTWSALAVKCPDQPLFQERLERVRCQVNDRKIKAVLQEKFGTKWDTICPICMVHELSTVLIPCGHVLCEDCSNNLKAKDLELCPVCRASIADTVKPYARLLTLDD